jgi:hypothetical protein
VIAVGRTPRKLEKARELGAEHAVRAGAEDVARRVREITRGHGADVVFELVATKETMAASLASLAKRGRLVFVGYSFDELRVSPIQLVVGEQVVTASVGNTLAELRRAVDLVAEGRVKTVVDRTLPLSEARAAQALPSARCPRPLITSARRERLPHDDGDVLDEAGSLRGRSRIPVERLAGAAVDFRSDAAQPRHLLERPRMSAPTPCFRWSAATAIRPIGRCGRHCDDAPGADAAPALVVDDDVVRREVERVPIERPRMFARSEDLAPELVARVEIGRRRGEVTR